MMQNGHDMDDDDREMERDYPHAGEMRDLCLMIDRLAVRLGDVKPNGVPSWSQLGTRLSRLPRPVNRTALYDMRTGTAPKPTTLRALAAAAGEHVDVWYAAAGWPTGDTPRVINTVADLDADEMDLLRAAQRLAPYPGGKQMARRLIEATAALVEAQQHADPRAENDDS